VASCCECGDEHSGSCATELVKRQWGSLIHRPDDGGSKYL
jgi:hypothetical protein